MTIYVWPPVGLKSRPVWTVRDPIQQSRSLFTGARYAARQGRRRIYAEYSVSARKGDVGAGYMEALKRLLNGGAQNFVRLSHQPFERVSGADPLFWDHDEDALTWTHDAQTVSWTHSTSYAASSFVVDGQPIINVPGLPVSSLICLPGEFVSIADEVRMCIAPAYSNSTGFAVIKLDSAFSGSGDVSIGVAESGIFEVVQFPEASGPLGQDYTYDWAFSQVFEDEIGVQSEVNPWG